MLVLACVIILHILHKGRDTTLRVPEGSDVKIGADGRVDMKLPAAAGNVKAKPAAAAQPDEKAIQGTWKIVSSSLKLCRFPRDENGREVRAAADAVHRTTRVIITPETLKVLGEHVVGEAFQYKLNPAARPRMIDLLSGGRAALGIYELQGNRLRICTDEAPGAAQGVLGRSRRRARTSWSWSASAMPWSSRMKRPSRGGGKSWIARRQRRPRWAIRPSWPSRRCFPRAGP